MPRPSRKQIVQRVLDRYGRTFLEEAGGGRPSNTPSSLWKLLCLSLLLSARIRGDIAIGAARGLFAAGWTTPEKMARSTWQQRVDVLDEAGYVRYDERTATMLGEAAAMVLDRYGGDLRDLRREAERRPEQERRLLMQFNGIGPVGADIFLREVQGAWDEVAPFADRRALEAAERLSLPRDAPALARLVDPPDLPRLIAGLVRVQQEDAYDAVRAAGDGDAAPHRARASGRGRRAAS